ncbi:MAG: ester cyclase, partial [Thermomicrobiales bacterium]
MNRVLRFAFPTLVAVSLLMVSGSVAGQAQEATPAADCPATTTEENEAIARRWYDELWNPRDAAAIDALVSPDHVHHWAIGPDSEGAAAFAERAQATWSAFPAHYTVEQAVAEGDLVALRWIGQGAHEGEFGGIAATGKPVTLEGINIFRIECGKIVEVWSEMDGIGLRQQLGATDVPATAATPAAEMA